MGSVEPRRSTQLTLWPQNPVGFGPPWQLARGQIGVVMVAAGKGLAVAAKREGTSWSPPRCCDRAAVGAGFMSVLRE